MQQILNKLELVGKTIKKIKTTDDAMCIHFTDGSFAVWESTAFDYYYSDIEFCDYSLNITKNNSKKLLRLEIITQEQYEEINKK